MNVTPLNKHELRLELRKRRRCMSREMRERESLMILQQLLAWKPFREAQSIGCYLSMPDEVDTQPLIKHLLGKEVQLAVPVYDAEHAAYAFGQLTAQTPVKPGAFGVPEPATLKPIDLADLDLLLLPGRGFDRRGHRIGRGKGHIDTLLAAYPGISAGLAFHWQLVDVIPLEPHDQTLDAVVTPDEVLPSPQD